MKYDYHIFFFFLALNLLLLICFWIVNWFVGIRIYSIIDRLISFALWDLESTVIRINYQWRAGVSQYRPSYKSLDLLKWDLDDMVLTHSLATPGSRAKYCENRSSLSNLTWGPFGSCSLQSQVSSTAFYIIRTLHFGHFPDKFYRALNKVLLHSSHVIWISLYGVVIFQSLFEVKVLTVLEFLPKTKSWTRFQ